MATNLPFQLGKNIKKLREFRGYTQEYMAEQLGIGQKTYSNIEADTGKVNKSQIEKISDILDVHPLFLLSYDEKIVFNNENHDQAGMFNTYHNSPKEAELYERQITELKELVTFLKEEIAFLKGMIKKES